MNFQGVLNFQVLHTATSQKKKEEMIDVDKLKLINFHLFINILFIIKLIK